MKREVDRDSTFTLTYDLSYIASILFVNVNFTHVRMVKLRDSGNQPEPPNHDSQWTYSCYKETYFV